jgi:prepilin-type processing-associated H-X9-DG protein
MFKLVAFMLAALAVTAALAQAPAVDATDPAAVGRAYLDACRRWDADAATPLLLQPSNLSRLRRDVEGYFQQTLDEMLCLPLLRRTQYVSGAPAIAGDECRIPVTATYTLPETLVLRRQPDGSWKVDVNETILSTTGASESQLVRTGEQALLDDCLSNLRQLALALLMYAQDHDEALPRADKWCDEIMPYVKNTDVFKCPAQPQAECSYAFNAALSEKVLGKIERPAETIILFESGEGTRNACGNVALGKLLTRHNGGSAVAYVDGHVKWLEPQ